MGLKFACHGTGQHWRSLLQGQGPRGNKALVPRQLGLPVDDDGLVTFVTQDDPGPCTTWALFARDTKDFEPSGADFMINFRVRDLHAMLGQLRAAEPRSTR